jgi:hypothetical protein
MTCSSFVNSTPSCASCWRSINCLTYLQGAQQQQQQQQQQYVSAVEAYCQHFCNLNKQNKQHASTVAT